MNDLEVMLESIVPYYHPPQTLRKIENKYSANKEIQQGYQFPFKPCSVESSLTNKSLQGIDYYNLNCQNKNISTEISNIQSRHRKIKLTKENEHKEQKTYILELKRIREIVEKKRAERKEKLTLTNSKQKTPQKRTITIKAVNGQIKRGRKLSLLEKVQKQQKKSPKTRSSSKKRLSVMSANKFRRIQSFNINLQRTPSKKGLRVYSNQKRSDNQEKYGVNVRTINIY